MDFKSRTKISSRQISIYLTISCLIFNLHIRAALAGPEGAQVVNGQVSFQQSGYNTNITASDKAIINYSSFDIARPETVQFIQPSRSASVLNRILSANPTNINGTLLANGRVFFVNPAGVYIGNGARINVAQLVASSLNISNSDFINGQYNFAGGTGSVINSGDITAEKVYLIGKQVANFGNISCPAGYVVMASGDRVFLGERGSDVMLEIDVPSLPEPVEPIEGSGVLNEGTVEAGDGTIILAAAGDIYSQAISNIGTLSASSDTGSAGQVKLTATEGTVINSGSIEAKSSSGTGGTVQVLGDKVGLFGTGQIDVSGSNGGGTALVGGDYKGEGDVPTASRTYVSPDSTIKADAIENGDGGKVIVWSDEITVFYGSISARGGADGGDGGFVEVSGKDNLGFYGYVDTLAPQGDMGTLLLDPTDIFVSTSDGTDGASGGDILFADTPTAEPWNVTTGQLIAVGANLTLQAMDDITISGPVILTTNGAGITARAGDDIIVGAPIITRGGSIDLTANDSGGTQSGDGEIDLNAALDTTGNSRTGGAVTLTIDGGTGSIELNDDITTSTANITFEGPVILTADVAISTTTGVAGTITFQSTLDGTTDFAEDLSLTAGSGSIDFDGIVGGIKDLGDVTIASAGNVTADAAFSANTLTQQAGGGDTQFDGAVTLDAAGGMQLTTNTVTINSTIDTLTGGKGGIVTIANNDLLDIAVGADMTLDGAFIVYGIAETAGDITTTGDDITFNDETTLTDGHAVAFSSGAGAGDITFYSLNGTTDFAEDVSLTAGAGNINLQNGVGLGTALGDITIVSAANVDVGDELYANTLTQQAGTGDTTFWGKVTLDAAGSMQLTTNTVTLRNDIDTLTGNNGGIVTITNAGLLKIVFGADMTLDGAFTQNGDGEVETAGNITTTGDNIAFEEPVTLTNGHAVAFSTGTGAGNITFYSLDGMTDFAEDVSLTAGAGNITLQNGAGLYTALGDITIVSAANVSVGDELYANTFTQQAGTGNTTFWNTVTLDAAGGMQLTTDTVTIKKDIDTLTGGKGGIVTITNAGILDIAPGADMSLDGAFTANGVTETAGDITTTNDNITFGDETTLTDGHAVAFSTGAGAGDISIYSLYGTTDFAEDLTLTAGAGNITIAETVGTAAKLGDITIVSAADVTFGSEFFADSLTQSAGTGTTQLGGPTTVAGGLSISTGSINIADDVTAGTTIALTSTADEGLVSIAAGADVESTGGAHTYTADKMDIAGTITATGQTVTLKAESIIDDDAIRLGSAVDTTANTLELSDTELDNITATTIVVGESGQSGAITVSADTGPANATNLHLISNSSVFGIAGGLVIPGLAIEAAGTITILDLTTDVDTLAIDTSIGNILFRDADGFSVGTVDGVAGVRTGGGVSLFAITGDITVTNTGAADDIGATTTIALRTYADEAKISIAAGADVESTGGAHTYIADKMDIAGTITATGQTVTLKAESTTDDDAINLGSAVDTTANTLELSDTELDNITATTIVVGESGQSGAITVGADMSPANATNLHLISNSTVTGTSGGLVVSGLAVGAAGAVTITDATTDVDTLAIDTSTGNIQFTDADGFSVGTVDSIAGVDTDSGSVTLTATTGNLTVTNTTAADDIGATTTIALTAAADEGKISIESGADVESTGGNHTYTADKMDIAGTITATGRWVYLSPRNADAVDIGSAVDTTANTLELSDTELDNITALVLRITTGLDAPLTVSADISPDNIISFLDLVGYESEFNINGAIDTLTAGNGCGLRLYTDQSVYIALGADITLDGAFSHTEEGDTYTAGDITTTGDDITFNRLVTLTDGHAVAFSTGAGAGNITFSDYYSLEGTTDFAENLTLTAGIGNITFNDTVGNTKALGDVTIVSAADVTAVAAFNANALTQQAGTGDTQFDGAVTLAGAGGMQLTTNTVTINSTIDTLTGGNGGIVTITNAGLLGIAAGADMTLDGAFTQNGAGAVETAGDITTTDDNINFLRAVTLGGDVDIDTTGTAAGNILFSSTIATGGHNLALDAGAAGNITLSDALTGGGDVTVRDGAVQSYQAMTLNSLDIQDATTSVTFGGDIAATTTIDVVSGGTIVQNGKITSGTNLDYDADSTIGINDSIVVSGTADIDSTGVTTVAAAGDITAGGAVTFGAAKSGTLTTSGDVDTSDDDVTFTRAVTLGGDVDIDTGAGAGDITFQSTLDGTTALTENLTLTAGTGDITFSGVVGGGTTLGDVTVNSADDALVQAAFNADNIVITASDTTIDIDDDVTAAGDIELNNDTDVADGVTLTAGNDLKLGAGKTMTGEGDLTLVATAGGITEKVGDDDIFQINMAADDKTLTLTQNDALDTANFSVTNDEDTVLVANSTGSSVTSTTVGAWQSIAANASGDLTLTNLNNSDPITIGNLTSCGEIWVQSIADLTVPAGVTLTANGTYSAATDDRSRVYFQTDGGPIDVAIYLASYDFTTKTGGNVTVNSAVSMTNNGTMVIDAYDTVNTFGSNFTSSAPWSNPTNRLEVVSRISQSLDDAINNNRLPHASEARGNMVPSWFGGQKYVLRGKEPLAEVLAAVGAVPIVLPISFKLESRDEVTWSDIDIDMEALLQWLAEELGEETIQTYIEDAYLHSTDLRPYKAAARLMNLAAILEDPNFTELSALAAVVGKVVEEPLPFEGQINPFKSVLLKYHRDDTLYDRIEWLDALATYVSILNTEIGWSSERSIRFVMSKYCSELDMASVMFVEMYLRSLRV